MSRTARRGLDARLLAPHPSLHRVRRVRRLLGAALLGSLLALAGLVLACPDPAHASETDDGRTLRESPRDRDPERARQVESWRRAWVTEFRPVLVAADRLGRELSLPLPRPEPFCRALGEALDGYDESDVAEAPGPLLRRHLRLAENAFSSAVDRCLAGRPTAMRAHLLRALGSLRHLDRELARLLPRTDAETPG